MVRFPGAIFILVLLTALYSCSESPASGESIAPLDPTMQAEVVRFEQLIKVLPEDDLVSGYRNLAREYPGFAQLYSENLIEARDSLSLLKELTLTRTDSSYLQLQAEVENRLEDLDYEYRQLSQLLENYSKLLDLPPSSIPRVYTFISGFAYQAFVFDDGGKNGVGLGLDMFLGEDFPYQEIHPADPLFSYYLSRTYSKEHIVRKAAEVLVEDIMIPPQKSDFLHLMIWGGKKLYIIDQLLDFVPDSIVTEYTQDQLEWCRDNQAEMWQFFFEEDLFYASDLRRFSKLVGPAPTSPGMPKESPGRTGNYMGWQIVKAFMERNPGTSIRQLIAFNDAQALLDQSRYKPPR